MPSSNPQVQRRTLATALQYMLDDPVVLIEGPRSVGKSTLLKQIASERNGRIVDLDDPAVLEAARDDPKTLIADDSLVCIDEYQKAPLVLQSLKAALNQLTQPGRFVITGSASFDSLPLGTQALTGRVSRLRINPLSQGEIAEIHENWLERFLSESADTVAASGRSMARRTDYVERICVGGFPLALAASSAKARDRWIDSYLAHTLQQDVRELSRIRQETELAAFTNRLAGQTAQVLNVEAAARSVGLNKVTASEYLSLLEHVFLMYRLPAWGKTLSSRTGKLPKVHLTDAAIAARMLRLSSEKLAVLDPTTMTEFGHLLETFVVGEILKQASWLDGVQGLGHWRTHNGDEVDLVVERDDGKVAAFEVKSSTRVTDKDVKSLAKLQEKLGTGFLGGVVFYLGEYSYSVAPGLFAVPVDRLWTALS